MNAPNQTFDTIRLTKLHKLLRITLDIRKVKVDAWFIKKSCVLIKKKITRGQFPNNDNFVTLMNIMNGNNGNDDDDDDDVVMDNEDT